MEPQLPGCISKILPALCVWIEIVYPDLFSNHTNLIGEAGGCVESHAGVVSSRTRDGAINNMIDFKQNLGNWVLLHHTVDIHLQVSLTCYLSICGGVGSNAVCVHNSAFLKLKERILQNENQSSWENTICSYFLEGDELAYLSDVATCVKGVAKDHLETWNLWSAVRIVQVQAVAVISQRVQVWSIDHNVHVVGGAFHSTWEKRELTVQTQQLKCLWQQWSCEEIPS